MSRSFGLLALLALAIVLLITAVGMNPRVRVVPAPVGSAPETTAVAPVNTDAGSLDSILDAVHVEHLIKRGR